MQPPILPAAVPDAMLAVAELAGLYQLNIEKVRKSLDAWRADSQHDGQWVETGTRRRNLPRRLYRFDAVAPLLRKLAAEERARHAGTRDGAAA